MVGDGAADRALAKRGTKGMAAIASIAIAGDDNDGDDDDAGSVGADDGVGAAHLESMRRGLEAELRMQLQQEIRERVEKEFSVALRMRWVL